MMLNVSSPTYLNLVPPKSHIFHSKTTAVKLLPNWQEFYGKVSARHSNIEGQLNINSIVDWSERVWDNQIISAICCCLFWFYFLFQKVQVRNWTFLHVWITLTNLALHNLMINGSHGLVPRRNSEHSHIQTTTWCTGEMELVSRCTFRSFLHDTASKAHI